MPWWSSWMAGHPCVDPWAGTGNDDLSGCSSSSLGGGSTTLESRKKEFDSEYENNKLIILI